MRLNINDYLESLYEGEVQMDSDIPIDKPIDKSKNDSVETLLRDLKDLEAQVPTFAPVFKRARVKIEELEAKCKRIEEYAENLKVKKTPPIKLDTTKPIPDWP